MTLISKLPSYTSLRCSRPTHSSKPFTYRRFRASATQAIVTRFMEEMSYLFLLTLFSHCRSLSPWWPLVFLIFSLPLQIFHVVLPTKNISFVFCFFFFFISRSSSVSVFFSLSLAGLSPSLLSLFLVFLFLYIQNL